MSDIATQTTSDLLMEDAKEKIHKLHMAIEWLLEHREWLDKFGPCGSVQNYDEPALYLHDPPQDVKDVCRTIPGDWKRQRNNDRVDYVLKDGPMPIHIFNAERVAEEALFP